jgi:iron(III) transport system permease protein
MSRWRFAVALVLALLVGLPLLWPIPGALDPAAWPDADTLRRMLLLWRTTLVLVVVTLALALPAGVVAAVLLERTDLPGRRLFSVLLLATLFIPLPLFTSAWQIVLSRGWEAPVGPWAPWSQGIGSAAWIHAAAGLPWVVLLTSWGLRGVERELEEDALLLMGPVGVLWRVSLPRCIASIAAAGLWVSMQTATEITVTDVMQVRTAAEEVLTQFILEPEGSLPLARTVAASLGQVVVSMLLVLALARHADRLAPAGRVQLRPAVVVPLGRWRWPLALLMGTTTLTLTVVPVGGLLWRAGRAGMPPSWSVLSLVRQIDRTCATDGGGVFRTLAVALAAGTACAALALVACWLARESRWLRIALLILLAAVWATPGPVIGLGLKGVFRALLDLTRWPPPLAHVLWYGPSYVPLLWVYGIRLLPFAVAFLWPLVRLLPRELFEAGRLDGAAPRQELLGIVAPLLWPACLRAALAVAVLSLGELSGGKLVSTPGAESYAEMVFAQMHYGVTADLAARCLLLLGVVLVGALLFRLLPIR